MRIEEIYYSNYDKIFHLSDYMLHCVGPVVHYRTLYIGLHLFGQNGAYVSQLFFMLILNAVSYS